MLGSELGEKNGWPPHWRYTGSVYIRGAPCTPFSKASSPQTVLPAACSQTAFAWGPAQGGTGERVQKVAHSFKVAFKVAHSGCRDKSGARPVTPLGRTRSHRRLTRLHADPGQAVPSLFEAGITVEGTSWGFQEHFTNICERKHLAPRTGLRVRRCCVLDQGGSV